LLFLPSILSSPLYLFSPDKWYSIFAYCVESAGPVFIKLAQYVSQRGDLFNEQLAEKFNHLREHCKTHSYEESRDLFKESFGQELGQVFDKFDKTPIASGSIGQVYKASIGNEDYVVKVRHPGVKEMIDKDLTIIFGAVKVVCKMPGLSSLDFPATVEEFKKVLYEQTNLSHESKNLIKFTKTFKKFENQVIFPIVKDNYVSESILVESFIDAKPISYYMENAHSMNPLIAKVGMNVLYRMIFYENFVHSDCHAGNILV
jgi:aarF domain-containing kinase